MLEFYVLNGDRLELVPQDAARERLASIVWCDLLEPTKEEERFVESLLEIEIPTRDEMAEIELSNRFYQYNGAVFATATLVTQADTPEPETHSVSFVLAGAALMTVRYAEPFSFKAYKLQTAQKKEDDYQGNAALVDMLELNVNRIADLLENASHRLDTLNHSLFRPSLVEKEQRQQNIPDFEDLLRQIGIHGDLLSKIRESLVSLTRLIGFVSGSPYIESQSALHARMLVLLRDISALNEQANFLSNRVNFLLDATFGMVGIQQTSIIKIFSVASVVFLPPTLVASIYGMNFEVMPELRWVAGYPMSIGMMILSALLPYRFFKQKGWL